MGVTKLILELQAHKAKIRVFLRGYSIAIVTEKSTKKSQLVDQ